MPVDRLDYPRYLWHLLNGFRVRHEQQLAACRAEDIQPYLDLRQPRLVLDLANGRLRPQYAVLRAAGHYVYGIDLINRPRQDMTDALYVIVRRLFAWRLGVPPATINGRTLIGGNVGVLPFADGTFELITSIAAFEHFLEVPRVVAELRRITRPGGLVWVCIHPFTSLSGGHNVSLSEIPLRHISSGIDPWDHLRQRRLPFHVPLNEWRIDQYLAEFSRSFEIVKHYCAMREGEEFLTPAIESELTAYSRDELTCNIYIIVARKRGGDA
jgi:SAM-dependent methyltransferase